MAIRVEGHNRLDKTTQVIQKFRGIISRSVFWSRRRQSEGVDGSTLSTCAVLRQVDEGYIITGSPDELGMASLTVAVLCWVPKHIANIDKVEPCSFPEGVSPFES